tara:strand:+ start:1458 stop:1799 length:342 start_codon:yes stop_codon:yes gene_type:complete
MKILDLLLIFWHGKIKLWKSYWLVGELFNSLVILAICFIEINILNNNVLYNQLPLLNFNSFNFINKILFLTWSIFITVGIWRSAENYKGRIIWTILTLVFLCYRIFSLRLLLF